MGLFANFSKLLGRDQYQESNYLSLVLAPDRVTALIWTFDDGLVRELGFGQKAATSPYLILHQAALAIDIAGEEAKVDFTKTVFGLSSNWLENGELSGKGAKILKKLADELELAPQAFVPIAVSINHLLKVETPAPQVVAIGLFAQAKQSFCEVHLIDRDKVVATSTSDLPPTLQKVKEQIRELAVNRQLPAHVVIYGVDPQDRIAKEITSSDWQDYFVQEPKFDFLGNRQLARAVAYAQAADLLGHEPPARGATLPTPPPMAPQKPTNELGFIEGEDILLTQSQPPKIEPQPAEKKSEPQSAVEAQEPVAQIEESPIETTSPISKLLPVVHFSFAPQKLVTIILAFLILATIAVLVAGQFLTKAEVTIKVAGQEHQDNFQVTVKEGIALDTQKSQIPGQIVTASAQGNQKAVTTGSQKIGEPARGEVTVLNWTTATKKFPQGTAIISKNGLKFTLDSDVEVASRSASTPGKNKVGATAVEGGESSNLSQGTEFTFVAFDEISYSAQAETNFAGGSEKQVTIVTQEDATRLEKSLTETLTTRAREDLKNKSPGKLLLDDAVIIKIKSKNFDKKVDEEAALLTLDMEVEALAFVFDEGDLKKLLAEISNFNIDAKLVARPENLETRNIKVKRENSSLTLTGDLRVSLVPRFNEDELVDQIAGKSEKAARATILQIAGASDVRVTYSPNLPFGGSLPRNREKISIKVETK